MQVAVISEWEFVHPWGESLWICRWSAWLCWPGLSTEQVTVIAITIADCHATSSSAFLVPRHLYTSQLSSLCRVKLGQDHCSKSLKGWRSSLFTSFFLV